MRNYRRLRFVCIAWILAALPAMASGTFFWGPETLTLRSGRPEQSHFQFAVDEDMRCGGKAAFVLLVESRGISSAAIALNGSAVAGPSDFRATDARFERRIEPRVSNVLSVQLHGGRPDAVLTMRIRRDAEKLAAPAETLHLSRGGETFERSFHLADLSGTFVLSIRNGDADGLHRISSGRIWINGQQIAGPDELHSSVAVLHRDVILQSQNDVRVEARGQAGDLATISFLRQLDPRTCDLALSFNGPEADAHVASATIIASGTVTGPLGIGVSVNGFAAEVDMSHAGTATDPYPWFADVTAEHGPLTLVAVATSPSGATATAERDVLFLPDPRAIILQAHPRSGINPLPVALSAVPTDSGSATACEIDWIGSGVFAPIPPEAEQPLSHTYDSPGRYRPTVRCATSSGEAITASTFVIVNSWQTMDTVLRDVWNRFTSSLAASDVDSALRELSPRARSRYDGPLRAIRPALPSYVASITAIDPVWIREGAAHYLLRREQDGRISGYHVYLTRGSDGIWRVSQF